MCSTPKDYVSISSFRIQPDPLSFFAKPRTKINKIRGGEETHLQLALIFHFLKETSHLMS